MYNSYWLSLENGACNERKIKRKRKWKKFKRSVDRGGYIWYITKAVARQQGGAESTAEDNTMQNIELLKKTFEKMKKVVDNELQMRYY